MHPWELLSLPETQQEPSLPPSNHILMLFGLLPRHEIHLSRLSDPFRCLKKQFKTPKNHSKAMKALRRIKKALLSMKNPPSDFTKLTFNEKALLQFKKFPLGPPPMRYRSLEGASINIGPYICFPDSLSPIPTSHQRVAKCCAMYIIPRPPLRCDIAIGSPPHHIFMFHRIYQTLM